MKRISKMTIKSGKSVYLQAVTMIDPVTGWIEYHTYGQHGQTS